MRQRFNWVMGLAILLVSTAQAEIPGLSPMEREARLRERPAPVSLDAFKTIHQVAPSVRVRESSAPAPLVGPQTRQGIRDYLESTRPSRSMSTVLTNGGFETGDFTGWTLTGALGDPGPSVCGVPWPADAFITNPGLLPGANNDPCINLVDPDPKMNPNTHSAQLGDDLAWGFSPSNEPKCSSVSQLAVIPVGVRHFIFSYAVMASNPGHGVGQDPYFQVVVRDSTDHVNLYNVIDYTTSFDPLNPCNPWCGGTDDPGNPGAQIVYRCWTRVDMDLSRVAGHLVQLSLLASDCSPSGHFCKAFLDGAGVFCTDSIPPDGVRLAAQCFEDPNAAGTFCTNLSWIAPSDSSAVVDSILQSCVAVVQAAASYDIRWSTSPIVTAADFAAANQVAGEPTPGSPGTPESMQVCGLPADTIYVALQSADVFNTSALSTASTLCTSNQPPDCSAAAPSLSALWPPNHKFVTVSINGVTDPDRDLVTIQITKVTQDEPLDTVGDGNTCPDAIIASGSVQLRAERTGTPRVPGNGRVYMIHFTATDGRGGSCEDSVTVCCPHDQGQGRVCIDDGQDFISTGPCGPPANPARRIRAFFASAQNRVATFEYGLAREGAVNLSVYDVAGRRLATLVDSRQKAGTHSVNWSTQGLPSGVYYARLHTAEYSDTKRLVVVQ